MANQFTNTQKVSAEGLRLLRNGLKFCKLIKQSWTKEFKAPESIGDSVEIPIPFNATIRKGATASPEDFFEGSVTLTIDEQTGQDCNFGTLEKELDIKEFSKRYMRSPIANISAQVEKEALELVNQVSNVITNSTLTHTDVRRAKARMESNLTPMDGSWALFINPEDEVAIMTGTEAFFHSGKELEKEFKDSSIGVAMGYKWYTSNLIPNLNIGTNTARTVAVNANVADGASEIVLKNLDATGTVLAGEVFSITGVKAVNYQTKGNMTYDRQFCVLADATAVAGVVTLSVAEMNDGSTTAGKKNISALPATDDVVVFLGVANASYPQSIAFHPEFMTMAFADPRLPKGVNESGKYTEDSITMRYVEDFDSLNDKFLNRFDTYYGFALLRSDYAVRIIEI
jgi:hypothetical protein